MPNQRSTIVVGVDGTAESDVAVRWAANEAAARRLALELLFAYTSPTVYGPDLAYPGPLIDPDSERRAAQSIVDMAIGSLKKTEPDVPEPMTTIVERHRIGALLDASKTAAMVVVGSRRLGAIGSTVLGSLGSALAARAACPAVIVRGPAGERTAGAAVVAGIDLGALSESVLAFAFDHASRYGVPLRAVLCWNLQRPYNRWASRAGQELRARGERMLADAVAGWQEKYPHVTVQRQLLDTDPIDGLVGASRGAHLLVVGAHGRNAAFRAVLGSVSQGVLHHATCPVAVVHAEDSTTDVLRD